MTTIFIASTQSYATDETLQEQILRISSHALSEQNSIMPEELHNIISNNDTSYYIISLQSVEDFAKAHVPGAVRIDVDYVHPESALNLLPRNKVIVVTDVNGQLSCQMTTFLRQLGYDARTLLLGMFGWNGQYAGTGAFPEGRELPVTEKVTALPLVDPQRSKPSGLDDTQLILQQTHAYASQKRPASISHKDLKDMKGDVLVVSMQTPEDYAYAHIPGAASLPAKDFISGDPKLLQLPRDKKIVVTCYIGHYSNVGAMILNQLGYEAYSLDWGLAGWNVSGFKKIPPFLEHQGNFPVEKTVVSRPS